MPRVTFASRWMVTTFADEFNADGRTLSALDAVTLEAPDAGYSFDVRRVLGDLAWRFLPEATGPKAVPWWQGGGAGEDYAGGEAGRDSSGYARASEF